MLGDPLLAGRLRDLHAVVAVLRERRDLDGTSLALWGDSFAPVNPGDRRVDVPLDAALPEQSEPLGSLLALLGGLFLDDAKAVYARGGLASWRSCLESPFCYFPHDAVVPGAAALGELADLAALLAPRPLRLEQLVDGVNRRVSGPALRKAHEPTQAAYERARAAERLQLDGEHDMAKWLLDSLKAR
jgi:hypothetical protein